MQTCSRDLVVENWGSIPVTTQIFLFIIFQVLLLRSKMAARPLNGMAIVVLFGLFVVSIFLLKNMLLVFTAGALLGIAITAFILITLFFNHRQK